MSEECGGNGFSHPSGEDLALEPKGDRFDLGQGTQNRVPIHPPVVTHADATSLLVSSAKGASDSGGSPLTIHSAIPSPTAGPSV